tara:strand:- start:1001 stop:2134 length:1134 start_codon:yes stop_codon:yes gene_type:complete
MGAYENPQRLQTYADQMAKNITNFYQSTNASISSLIAKAKKDLKDAEKKEAETFGSVDAALSKIEQDSKGFLGLSNEKEAAGLEKQIQDNLELIRSRMDKEITPDMSLREINKVKSKYVNQISTFKADLDNLAAAYREWNESKGLKPNQEGAIVASYNPEMISIFKAWDDDKYNVRITAGPDGDFQISELDFDKPKGDGSYEVSNSLNLTNWRNKSATDGYFQNATKLDLKPVEQDFENLIKDGTLGKAMYRNKVGTDSQGKALKGTEKYYVFDKDKYAEWKKTPAGQQYADNLVDSKNAEGYWQALGTEDIQSVRKEVIDPTTGMPKRNNDGDIVYETKEESVYNPYLGQEYSPANLRNAIFDVMANKYSQATNIQ